MTDTALIKAVAEFMGWHFDKGQSADLVSSWILIDLNLWQDKIEPRIEEKGLMEKFAMELLDTEYLIAVDKTSIVSLVRASARDKSEALLRVVR